MERSIDRSVDYRRHEVARIRAAVARARYRRLRYSDHEYDLVELLLSDVSQLPESEWRLVDDERGGDC